MWLACRTQQLPTIPQLLINFFQQLEAAHHSCCYELTLLVEDLCVGDTLITAPYFSLQHAGCNRRLPPVLSFLSTTLAVTVPYSWHLFAPGTADSQFSAGQSQSGVAPVQQYTRYTHVR